MFMDHRECDDVVPETARERAVIVPCSASNGREWKAFRDQFRHVRSVTVDHYGHANRPRWHGSGPMSLLEEAAAIAEAFPDSERFHLVGHSYGGGVALRFALSAPERLQSLTLIEPSCFHLLKSARDGALLDEIRGIAGAVNHAIVCGDYCSGMRTFMDYWGGRGSWDALRAERRAQLAQLAVHVAHHFWNLMEECLTLDSYAKVDVPTLIVCGTRSPHPSREITHLLAKTLPRSRHHTIRDATHMSPFTHAQELQRLIVQHWRLYCDFSEPGQLSSENAQTINDS